MLALIESTLRISAPLVFAAMGGLLSERSGVIQIGLEGLMIVGGLIAAVVALETHSPGVALAGAALGGAVFGSIYAWLAIRARANQIVAGTGMNFLAMGLAPFVLKVLYGNTGTSPSLPIEDRMQWQWGVALALIAVAALAWLLRRTPVGLWIRFAGEHPQALQAAGVRPERVRHWAVVSGSALAAMGGAVLAIGLASAYSRNMVAGRGFMALTALIFGKWRAWPALGACLLFGFAEALQFRLGSVAIPAQFVQILPYAATLLVLAGFVGRARAPSALGR
ncbi:MAG: ABC transporter permease [Oligoflexia bacterium]